MVTGSNQGDSTIQLFCFVQEQGQGQCSPPLVQQEQQQRLDEQGRLTTRLYFLDPNTHTPPLQRWLCCPSSPTLNLRVPPPPPPPPPHVLPVQVTPRVCC